MFDTHITKHLREGEVIKEIIRRSLIMEAARLVGAVVLILGVFFFLVPLFHAGPWGVAVFFVLLIFGIVWGVRTWFVWSVNVFVLTSERLVDIDQHGFFTTIVSSAQYQKIQDISFSVKGVWQTLFHIGSVEVQTAGSDVRLELTGVRDPQHVQELLTHELSQRGDQSGLQAAERLLKTLERVETSLPSTRPAKTGAGDSAERPVDALHPRRPRRA